MAVYRYRCLHHFCSGFGDGHGGLDKSSGRAIKATTICLLAGISVYCWMVVYVTSSKNYRVFAAPRVRSQAIVTMTTSAVITSPSGKSQRTMAIASSSGAMVTVSNTQSLATTPDGASATLTTIQQQPGESATMTTTPDGESATMTTIHQDPGEFATMATTPDSESARMTTTPGGESATMTTTPDGESATTTTTADGESATVTTIQQEPGESATMTTTPEGESATMSTTPDGESATMTTIHQDPGEFATMTTTPDGESATMTTISHDRAATMTEIPRNASAASTTLAVTVEDGSRNTSTDSIVHQCAYLQLKRRKELASDEQIQIIVPGLGRANRAQLLQQNLERLGATFPTSIYLYRNKTAPGGEFDLTAFRTACRSCRFYHNLGKSWAYHIKHSRLLNNTRYVLLLLDDIQLSGHCPLDVMMVMMDRNNLSTVSVTMNNRGTPYQIMRRDPAYKFGRRVDYVEFFVTLFTREAYMCFQKIINKLNWKGWGYDWHFGCLCTTGGMIGLLDMLTAQHRQDLGMADADKTVNYHQWINWEKQYGCESRVKQNNLGALLGPLN